MADWSPLPILTQNAEDVLIARYGLDRDPLSVLMDTLMNYGTRHVWPDWSKDNYKKVRRDIHSRAKKILRKAKDIARLVRELERQVSEFEDKSEHNPTLMDDIFSGLDFKKYPGFFGPPALAPVTRRHAAEASAKINDVLVPYLNLPVRPGLAHGGVANTAVETVVAACRDFWLGQERVWPAHAFDGVEDGFEVQDLEGDCVHFVVDVLRATGFPFDIVSLKRAWRPTRRKGANKQ